MWLTKTTKPRIRKWPTPVRKDHARITSCDDSLSPQEDVYSILLDNSLKVWFPAFPWFVVLRVKLALVPRDFLRIARFPRNLWNSLVLY